MKGFQLCHESKSYICNWVNLLVNVFEVSLYVLSIMFVSVFWTPCMCLQKWQWQIGVIAILLAWVNLIRVFAKFPSTGIYVIMFGRILLTFLKVIVLSVLLLTTFAITFHMTFSEAQFQVSHIHKNRPVTFCICILANNLPKISPSSKISPPPFLNEVSTFSLESTPTYLCNVHVVMLSKKHREAALCKRRD